jgi:diketogulonate reductase-like aldo/keto reductase
LIHGPRGSFKGNLKETWKGMEEAKRTGLAKSIGISNSGTPEIEEILSVAEIIPAVNQVGITLRNQLRLSN